MIPHAEVLRVLNLLGSTPAAVAQTLAAKGIHGKRGRVESCPVAVYLREQFPETPMFVTDYYVAFEDQDEAVQQPLAIRAFVAQFDHGDHPELES